VMIGTTKIAPRMKYVIEFSDRWKWGAIMSLAPESQNMA